MEQINALGRRKSAVARIFVTEGSGKITINKRDLTEYFPSSILQFVVKQPLALLEATEKYDIKVNLNGGGFTGQSQALRLAIARALVFRAYQLPSQLPHRGRSCVRDDTFLRLGDLSGSQMGRVYRARTRG